MNFVKYNIYLVFIIFLSLNCEAQDTIRLADNSFKMKNREMDFYHGFAQGDKLIFTFYDLTFKGLKEVKIVDLANNATIFSTHNSSVIENKVIDITHKGVYKISFSRSVFSKGDCQYILDRLPSSIEKHKFNSTVYWRTVYDTTNVKVPRTENVKQHLIKKTIEVHSKYNSNGNKSVCNFTLPSETMSWTYAISTKSPDDIEMYLSSREESHNFLFGNSFRYNKKIDTYNGLTTLTSPNDGDYSFCLLNDNRISPVTVTIDIYVNKLVISSVDKTVINSHKIPYLKN